MLRIYVNSSLTIIIRYCISMKTGLSKVVGLPDNVQQQYTMSDNFSRCPILFHRANFDKVNMDI